MQEELLESRGNRTIFMVVGLLIIGVVGYLMYLSIAAAKANKFMADLQLNALQSNMQNQQQSAGGQPGANPQDIPVFPATRSQQNK